MNLKSINIALSKGWKISVKHCESKRELITSFIHIKRPHSRREEEVTESSSNSAAMFIERTIKSYLNNW